MRETCARVLAAALMTGAIATAMGLPSLFELGGDAGQGLTAPPSSLQRSVRSPALLAPARASRAERRPATALSRERTTGAGVGPSRPALTAARSNPRPGGLTGKSPVPAPVPKPQPKPAPAPVPAPAPAAEPETRELSGITPAPPAPALEPGNDKKKSKGKDPGNSNGKDNRNSGGNKEKPADRGGTPASLGTDCPDTASAAEPKWQSEDDRRGHERDHDGDHDKDDGKKRKD